MKILLIHQYFLEKNDGGGSRFNEMTRIWEQAGHKITVLSGMVHYATGKKYEQCKGKFISVENYSKGILLYRCHVSKAYNKSFSGRLWAYISFVLSSIICTTVIKGRFDVILVTSPPLFVAITGIFASVIKKAPLIFEIRDLWPESAIDTGVLKNSILIGISFIIELLIYKYAKLINALTPAFKKILIEKKKVQSEKIIVIPNAADFDLSKNIVENCNRIKLREELGLNGKFVVIYVGAHGVANNLKQLIDAAEIMDAQDVLFLLVGDGMEKRKLIDEAKRRQVASVRFLETVPKNKVFEYIYASDIGISVLKRADTFKTIYSNKTFDYMACRKPVIMAIDGLSRELVKTAKCGLYAEPENAFEIANAVRTYQSNPHLVKMHGENGYRYALQHFNRETLASRYLEAIGRII